MPAVSITDTYTSLLATTLPARLKQLWDNLSDEVRLLKVIEDITEEQSGHRVEIPLLYGANSTVASRGGYDVVDLTVQDGITIGYVDWKDLSGSVVISDKDQMINSGKEAAVRLLSSKYDQLEVSFRNQLNSDLFSLGSNSNQIQGLQYWLRTSTATVAGIDDSVNTWWQNQLQTSVGSFATNGRDKMRTVLNDCRNASSNDDSVDRIFTTQAIFEYFEKTLEPSEMYMLDASQKSLNVGSNDLRFHGAVLSQSDDCLSGAMYFLNTSDKKIRLAHLPGGYMKKTPEVRPADQRAIAQIVSIYANLMFTKRRSSGVVTGVTA